MPDRVVASGSRVQIASAKVRNKAKATIHPTRIPSDRRPALRSMPSQLGVAVSGLPSFSDSFDDDSGLAAIADSAGGPPSSTVGAALGSDEADTSSRAPELDPGGLSPDE